MRRVVVLLVLSAPIWGPVVAVGALLTWVAALAVVVLALAALVTAVAVVALAALVGLVVWLARSLAAQQAAGPVAGPRPRPLQPMQYLPAPPPVRYLPPPPPPVRYLPPPPPPPVLLVVPPMQVRLVVRPARRATSPEEARLDLASTTSSPRAEGQPSTRGSDEGPGGRA